MKHWLVFLSCAIGCGDSARQPRAEAKVPLPLALVEEAGDPDLSLATLLGGKYASGLSRIQRDGTVPLAFGGVRGAAYTVGGKPLVLDDNGHGRVLVDGAAWLNSLSIASLGCPLAKLSQLPCAALPFNPANPPLRVAITGADTGELELALSGTASALGMLALHVAKGQAVAAAAPNAAGLLYVRPVGTGVYYFGGAVERIGDIARIAVETEREAPQSSGKCGPYYEKGSRTPQYFERHRVDHVIATYDRGGHKLAEKVFPGRLGGCAMIKFGLHGDSSPMDANAARKWLESQ